LYVAETIPSLGTALALVIPQMTQEVFGLAMSLPPDRWKDFTTYADAKAQWESEPVVRAIFEDGATDPIGAPHGNFEMGLSQWPPAETTARRWYLQPDGSLGDAAPTVASAGSSFQLDPDAGMRGILGPGTGLWSSLPDYDWKVPDAGFEVAFMTAPLTEDLAMLGTGSVDLWIRSQVPDADLEVNLTEVRPDGQERYVQSGWLRASFRKLTPASTALWPEPTMRLSDITPLPVGVWEPLRVAIAGFGHVFRKGSRIRIAVDTPGDSRADWRFDLLKFPGTVTYDIAHASAYPSSVVLPVLSGKTINAALPPCPSVRGEQCRPFTEHPNTPAL
jgi:predicted acyl esterase